uniref:UDENN domain-containing protein n=1 Tax=Anopheles farauti TaxID=69004 RepID=A0A182Q780_9DIPT
MKDSLITGKTLFRSDMNSRIKEDVSRLFEFWCEIAPGTADDSAPGHIVESFPESFKDAKVTADIPAFAFPCAFESRTIQVHSFVLTNIDSKWRFGFCRHDPKSPTAMVIITYLPWHDTFMRFLNVLADIRKNRPNEFASFLAESYNKGVPEPGACLKLHYDRASQTFLFQRPQQFQLPSIPENHNLNQYYNFVEPKFMIGIFAAMLAERRIIFVSRRLDILSSCVQAANAFLYPMVWQHIFIPVLPMQMKDILAAPMPFLIGVPEAVYETLRREEIGDVVILNCDKRTLETPFDDVKSMPQELVSSLKKQLANQADHRGDRVSKIFLGILVQLIGGYRDAVKFNDKITFDPETFIESRPSHLRPFLDKMLDLQIFQQFIEERLDMLNTGQGFSDEFEVEYFRYAEKSGRKTKQYKDLLKNFKDKVKEGGKGVKTAYKGLRSKFRETTPPKTKLDSSSSLHLHHQYDVGGHHQSAPNSPVFNKRPQTIALPDDLKPSNSSAGGAEGGSRPSSRAGAPVSPPNGSNGSALPRIQESVPVGASQPLLALDLEDTSRPCTSCNNNGSTEYHEEPDDFDLSPDAPCPPIPPRRFQSAADALAAIQISPPPMSPPSSSSSTSSPYRTYNNFVPPPVPKAKLAGTTTPSPSIIDQSPPLPSPPPPPPLKSNILQFDDDEEQLITLTTTTTTTMTPVGGGQAAAAPGLTSTTTSMSMTFGQPAVRRADQSTNHILPPLAAASHVSQQHSGKTPPPAPLPHAYTLPHPPKAQAPQPPQRPPLAPKPTFRKESQNSDTPDWGEATTPTPTKDDSLDLITLDTTNSSFELEDFDPLNERARPIGGGTAAVVTPGTSTALTTSSSFHRPPGLANASGVTVPTVSFPSTSLSVNNPVYPYFTPLYQQNVQHAQHNHALHLHHRAPGRAGEGQPQRPTSSGSGDTNGAGVGSGARESSVSDDFELLRNYGLDKFSLLDGGSSTKPSALAHVNGSTGSSGKPEPQNNMTNVSHLHGQQVVPNGRTKYSTPEDNSRSNGQTKSAFSNWTTFD